MERRGKCIWEESGKNIKRRKGKRWEGEWRKDLKKNMKKIVRKWELSENEIKLKDGIVERRKGRR